MAWTLNLLLVVGAIALVSYLQRTIQKIRRNAFVYPSEAAIDQVLPPEIMEQIFINLDYVSIINCSRVSKYWRHHAIKDQIQDHVVSTDTSLSLNIDQLKALLREHRPAFNLESEVKWLTYPNKNNQLYDSSNDIKQTIGTKKKNKPKTNEEYYDLRWRLEDQLFAKKMDKELIETNISGARAIYNTLSTPIAKPNYRKDLERYLVKIRGTLEYHYTNRWNIRDDSASQFAINMNEYKDGDKYLLTRNQRCEMIIELNSEFHRNAFDITKHVLKFRYIDNTPKIAGFPFGQQFVQLAFLMILPCIIVDYRNSPDSEAKYYANLIVHAIVEFLIICTAFAAQVPGSHDTTNSQEKRRVGVILSIVLILIGAIFYRWSLELTNYSTMIGTCFVYFFIWQDVFQLSYKITKIAGLIIVCLVILMNDWKLTVDAFKSGEILWTLLYNLFMEVQFGLMVALRSTLRNYYYKHNAMSSWRILLAWGPSDFDMMKATLWPLLFVTLYAPNTRAKVLI